MLEGGNSPGEGAARELLDLGVLGRVKRRRAHRDQYYTILSYTILYYTILYYDILHGFGYAVVARPGEPADIYIYIYICICI